jgi:glycerol-3-phosphate dehydrogenase
VVSATGPWVDALREINRSKSGKRLHLTKGVHIVVPHKKLPVKQSIYFDVDDGRMIFAIPRGKITYIGTTDTTYHGSPDHVTTSLEDADYLVKAVNVTFQDVHLNRADIESSWAGLRPLIHEEGKSASQLSRKDEIFESPSGLISIAGGKLTGYRKMAERVVNLVIKKHFDDKKIPKCSTSKIKLPGSDFLTRRSVKIYTEAVFKILKEYDLEYQTAQYLVENYGKQTDTIIQLLENILEASDSELKLKKAELLFCVNHEMVLTLSDFLIRRTGLMYFEIDKVLEYRLSLGMYMKELLKWDEERYRRELEELEQAIKQIKDFK